MTEGRTDATESKEEVGNTRPQALLFDFSWVLLHPKDRAYQGKLNDLNRQQAGEDPIHGSYDFSSYFELNTELLDYVRELKQRYNLPVYMFTTDIIQEREEMQSAVQGVFDRIFTARELMDQGVSTSTLDGTKTDEKSYQYIASQVGKKPGSILFIDDSARNLEAANRAGFKTIQYPKATTMRESNQQVVARVNQAFR